MSKPLLSFDGTQSKLWSSDNAEVHSVPVVVELPDLEPIEELLRSEPVDAEGN